MNKNNVPELAKPVFNDEEIELYSAAVSIAAVNSDKFSSSNALPVNKKHIRH